MTTADPGAAEARATGGGAAAIVPGRRWPVVSGLGVVMIFTWGSTYYLMAVLAHPVAEDTGWGLTGVTGALSAGLLAAGLSSPLVGRLIARHGGRPVLVAGCLTIATGLALIALAPALWVFWAGWLFLGPGMAMGLYDPAFATLGRLYGSGARSAITQLTLWGGFASTVCWPLSALILSHWGWRGVAATYAGISLFLLLPLVLLAIPHAPPPEPEDLHEPRKVASLEGREAIVFGLFSLLLVLQGLLVVNVATWLFTFLEARGETLAAAVALGTLIGPAQVGARVLEMAGRGRHHPVWTLVAAILSIATGLSLLALDLGPAGLALVLFGGGNGLLSIAKGSLPLALWGPKRYAPLIGRLARPGLVAQALAPLLGAWAISGLGAGVTLEMVAGLGLANVVVLGLMFRLIDRR